jgi:hypothetical protein
MAGVDLAPMLRRLAQLSDFQLGLAYTGGILPSVLIREWAAGHPYLDWLKFGAAGLGLITISALITVVAFYRDDDLLVTGILLAGITGLGTGVALAATVLIMTGSIGAVTVLVVGGFFAIVLRLILLAPIMAVAVWTARKFRRYLAPDTLPGASQLGGGEAA